MRRRSHYVLAVSALALVSFASGYVGLLVKTEEPYATPLWPPAGIALGALAVWGYRLWPGVAAGATLSLAAAGVPWFATLVIAAGATSQALIGAYVLHAARFCPKLERPRDVVALACAAVLSPIVVSTVGVSSLLATREITTAELLATMAGWWMTSVVSMLLVAPLVFAWHTRRLHVFEHRKARREAIALAIVLLVLASWTFLRWESVIEEIARPWVMFLPLIWAALRFGTTGASLASLAIFAFAQFAMLYEGREVSMWRHQPYFTILAIVGLSLAAVVASHRSAERRKAAILEGAFDAIITMDAAGKIRELNPRAEQLFGYRAEEILGRELAEVILPPDLRTAHREGLELYVTTGASPLLDRRTRMPALRKDGTQFQAELSIVRVPLPGPPLFTGFIRDMTVETDAENRARHAQADLERQVMLRTAELSRANRELASQRDQQAVAQQLAHVGSFEFDVWTRRLQWSDEMYRIYGVQPQSFAPTFDDFLQRIHPDDRPHVEAEIAAAIAELRPFSFEERIVQPDGTIRCLSSHGRVTADAQGQPISVIGSCQDITERRLAERQRDRLVRIVESSEDAIIGLDTDLRIETWNPGAEKLYGASSDDVVGKPISILVPAELVHAQRTRLAAVMQGSHVEQYETVHVRTDGTPFDASVTSSACVGDGGEITGIAEIIRDITPRAAMEKQLRNSLREKEVLLREIHHRVKNNLQVISSFLNLQLAKLDNVEATRALNESQSRIHSMALVHQLLYQSKDLASIHFAEYLRAIAQRLVTTYRPQQDVRIDVTDSPIRLDVDHAIPCGLIVNELLANALTHAFPGGRSGHIAISLLEEGDNYVLTVADDGAGIPAELSIDRIQSFGLKIARTLSQQLGGTFAIEREGGTIARVVFPMPAAAQRSAA